MVRCFISYSHKDSKYKDALLAHLSPLERVYGTKFWHDREISAGDDWKGKIDQNLEVSKIVLLLVSSDFIRSKYCFDKEFKKACELKNQGRLDIVPVAIRKVRAGLIKELDELNFVPQMSKPVRTPSNDDAWCSVVDKIKELVDKWASQGSMVDVSSARLPVENEFDQFLDSIQCSQSKLVFEALFCLDSSNKDLSQEHFENWRDVFVKSLVRQFSNCGADAAESLPDQCIKVLRYCSSCPTSDVDANLLQLRKSLFSFERMPDGPERDRLVSAAASLYFLVVRRLLNVDALRRQIQIDQGVPHWDAESKLMCCLILSAVTGAAIQLERAEDTGYRGGVVPGFKHDHDYSFVFDDISDRSQIAFMRRFAGALNDVDERTDYDDLLRDNSGDGSDVDLQYWIEAQLRELIEVRGRSVVVRVSGSGITHPEVLGYAKRVTDKTPSLIFDKKDAERSASDFLGVPLKKIKADALVFLKNLVAQPALKSPSSR